MYASNYHSYTHLIRALGIVREPTVCWFVTSEYPGIHDIGLPTVCTEPGVRGGDSAPSAAAALQPRAPHGATQVPWCLCIFFPQHHTF